MKSTGILLTLTGYQLTWIACVFGQSLMNNSFIGILVGSTFIILYFYNIQDKFNCMKIIFLIAIPGYTFDNIMVYLSIYEFNSTNIFLELPIWMIFLWISFAILYHKIFNFFKNYFIVGVIASGIFAPLTYYLGETIGVIVINDIYLFFIFMISFWCLLMIYYLKFLLKSNI